MTSTIEPVMVVAKEPEAPKEVLALTPLEHFLNSCCEAGSLMVFRVLMRFQRGVDPERMARAYATAVERHPLLRSRIVGSGNHAAWHESSALPVLEWHAVNEESLKAAMWAAIDPLWPTEGTGVRTKVFHNGQECVVCLDFQHTCCDGQGARRLIADWFTVYDQLSLGEEPQLTRLDPKRLPSRGHIVVRAGEAKVELWEGIRNFYVTIRGRTARLRRSTPLRSAPSGGALLAEAVLTVEETQKLREQLKACEATINDSGIAACLVAFRQMFPDVPSRQYATIANPVDCRGISDLRMPAANRWGLAFLRRRLKDCDDFSHVLKSIHDEMQYVKSHHVAHEFLKGLSVACQVPGALGFLRWARMFTPTLQFTCLGDTTRTSLRDFRVVDGAATTGGLRLVSISGFAPTVPGVPLSVCFCETNNRLSITVNGDANYVSPIQVEEFAKRLAKTVVEWAVP